MAFKKNEVGCPHNDNIYIASIKKVAKTAAQEPDAVDVFAITMICKDCGGRFRGEVRKA